MCKFKLLASLLGLSLSVFSVRSNAQADLSAAPPTASKDDSQRKPLMLSPSSNGRRQGPLRSSTEPGTRETNEPSGARAGDVDRVEDSYIIGPADLLHISVWREAEFSGDRTVRPDGKISLPLVNEIQAAGLTPEQLGSRIAESLSSYILHPLVTVAVQQINSKKYYIQGEVQKPGVYALLEPTTVLEALGNAGGFREFANTKNVLILRGTQKFRFNYKSVREGKNMEQNIVLQSGDQIIVR
ncbi:MAG TPA: polysaccharide biosynthesis/export family protein [Blastocatellia bacterium]|nr:polysaccharide biosynthesis/export family protein [Blastocatellia bacterium]